MTRAPSLPPDDALLTMEELGNRLHVHGAELRALIERSDALKAARRYRGSRPYFIKTLVPRHIHVEMSAVPTETSPASRRSA